jgi:hypothetical protein
MVRPKVPNVVVRTRIYTSVGCSLFRQVLAKKEAERFQLASRQIFSRPLSEVPAGPFSRFGFGVP